MTDKPHDMTNKPHYLNREIGLLKFQDRVLALAKNPAVPLLERVKFLSIVSTNLDEFFMVRVGGLIMQDRARVVDLSIDGRTPAEQLVIIRDKAAALMAECLQLWKDELTPALASEGIHIYDFDELNDKQKSQLQAYFERSIFPVLTPQAFDPGHPFPHISNLSLNLAVQIRNEDGEDHFARIKVPFALPRLVPVKRSSGGYRKDGTVPYSHHFVWLEQLIIVHLEMLFPGNEIVEAVPFRVTRNADIALQEMEADDLLAKMSENIHIRRFSPVIRLNLAKGMSKRSRRILTQNMMVNSNDVYETSGPLALGQLMQMLAIERYDLKDKPHFPRHDSFLPDLTGQEIFQTIRSADYLLHHPYDSFDPLIDLLRAAVNDPDVLAIKQTLYRVGANSPVVELLRKARREHRKQVTVLVELKARFDEASNIGWARMLEREGVHVIYGMVGLKTHAKTLMIVRREGDELRRYVHFGTGNFNARTARLYEDYGLYSCDEDLGADLTDLFNYLTGRSNISDFRKLLVAPLNLRREFKARIQREVDLAREGKTAQLIFKCNALVDRRIIDQLYEAGQAGVQVDLIVRGQCCLLPGVPGLSENIRVRCIVGRFLEHSRVYYFHNDGDAEIFIGSADLMTRNIDHRVETLVPVTAPNLKKHLRDRLLEFYLHPEALVYEMDGEGQYSLTSVKKPFCIQEKLIKTPTNRSPAP